MSKEQDEKTTTETRQFAHDAAETSSQNTPLRVRSKRNKTASSTRLHKYHALPDYLKDNEYIKGYYRRSMPIRDSVRSLFGLHNETGNIYTHLLGFLLFVFLTIYIAREPPTPLAFGHHQVDALWGSLHGRLQALHGSLTSLELPGLQQIQHNLQHLQGSLSEKVHSMQEGLSETVHHLQEELSETVHSMQERVHNLQEGFNERVHNLQEGITGGVHWLQDGIQHKKHQFSEAAAAKHVYEALSGVLLWPTARWPTYVYMAGAMTCLLLSSICHLLGCCQKHISQFVWRLDYAGIAILIVTSFYPPVYYGFMCHRFYLAFYLISTTALGVMAVMVSLLDKFQERAWRFVRASMFTALGLYGIVPVVHQWLLNSDVPQVKLALVYDMIMGITYVSGAVIYAMRVPERWFPGRFDLFFHSHQIFHVAVVAGAFIHYYSVKLMLEWRDASGGCALPVTSGHVSSVLQQMQELGHDLFSIEEVWSRLQRYMHAHLNSSGGWAELLLLLLPAWRLGSCSMQQQEHRQAAALHACTPQQQLGHGGSCCCCCCWVASSSRSNPHAHAPHAWQLGSCSMQQQEQPTCSSMGMGAAAVAF